MGTTLRVDLFVCPFRKTSYLVGFQSIVISVVYFLIATCLTHLLFAVVGSLGVNSITIYLIGILSDWLVN